MYNTEWIKGVFYVNHEYKAIYFPVAKNGSKTMESILIPIGFRMFPIQVPERIVSHKFDIEKYCNEEGIDYHKSTGGNKYAFIKGRYRDAVKIDKRIKNYYKFVIIRHPLEKFISACTYFIKKRMIHYDFFADWENKTEENIIKQIIENLKQQGSFDVHLLPQIDYCSISGKLIKFDLIFKLEEFNYGIEQLENRLGINLQYQIQNVSIPEDKQRIKNIIMNNKEIMNFINDFYRKDFKLYNSCNKQKEAINGKII